MGLYDSIGWIKSSRAPSRSYPFKKPKSDPVDPEEFRRYLVNTGIMEYLTKFLSKLSAERPINPIEKLKDNPILRMEMEAIKKQLAQANQKIQDLELQNKKLKQAQYQQK